MPKFSASKYATGLIALLGMTFLIGNSELDLQSSAVFQGEVWRLFTCHLVHTNWIHLLMDGGLLLIMLPGMQLRRDAAFILICLFSVSLSLLFLLETGIAYGGLSGLLYGLGAHLLWNNRNHFLRAEIPLILITGLFVKALWDLTQFPSPAFSDSSAIVIPQAHLAGLVAALLFNGVRSLLEIRTMKFSPKTSALLLAFLISGFLTPLPVPAADDVSAIHAQSLSQIPWFDYRRLSFHFGAGWVQGSSNQQEIENSVAQAGIVLDSFSLNVNRPGFQAGVNYELSDNWHLEFMYFNFGKIAVEASSTGITEDQLAAAFQDSLPGTGAGPMLSLKYNAWIYNPYHRLFVRAGILSASSGYDLSAGASVRRHEEALVLGGGYEYFYEKARSLRAEVNTSTLNSESVWYAGPTLVFYLDDVPREPMPQKLVAEVPPDRPEIPPEKTAPFRTVIYFAFDRWNIQTSEAQKLQDVKDYVSQHPNSVIVLSGHTDSYGDHPYNQILSQRRVEKVAQSLQREKNIPASQIRQSHHGKLKFASSNADKQGRQLNRRVNICVVDSESALSENCLGLDAKELP